MSNTTRRDRLTKLRVYASLLAWTALAGGFWLMWQPLAVLDRVWSEILLVSQERPADPDIVLVTVSNVDIRNRGVDRLDRVFLAETLERLEASGARRVLLDLLLSDDLSTAEEEALRRAARRWGPERLAISYEPQESQRPPAAMAGHVTLVDLRMIPSPDGYFREYRYPAKDGGLDPIAWLATGEQRSGSTPYDLRVDPAQFVRFSLVDVHSNHFDSTAFRDKLVILSTGRDAARMRVQLPLIGEVDRATLLAMATQSRREHYEQRLHLAQRWQAGMLGLVWLAGAWIGWAARRARVALACGVVLVSAVLWATSYLTLVQGTPSSPGLTLGLFFVTMYTSIAIRLKLPQMLTSCLSGDLSPEEAWAWRGQLDVSQPAVLFGTSGRVKRANAAARQAFGLAPPAGDPAGRALSKLCCPEWGQRAARVATEWGERRSWDLIWPHSELPLVLFNDVTRVALEHEKLRHELLHDPLTGALNRRGFEEAAAELQRQGSYDYAILFMDMNGFKQVNDQQGHEMGDRLLQLAAERFSSALRPTDKLSRWGGDEYAVLMLGHASLESVAVLAARLESVLREPIDLGTAVVKVGVAVGYAIPQPGEVFTAVLQRADEAMYARKALLKSQRQAASGSPATLPLN